MQTGVARLARCASISAGTYLVGTRLLSRHSFTRFLFLANTSSTATTTMLRGRQRKHLVLPRGRRSHGLDHLADELGPHLGHGLVLGERHVGEQRRVPNDAGLGVAVDVGLPLPARRVRVAGANVLGLEALELLLGAELVGLQRDTVPVSNPQKTVEQRTGLHAILS